MLSRTLTLLILYLKHYLLNYSHDNTKLCIVFSNNIRIVRYNYIVMRRRNEILRNEGWLREENKLFYGQNRAKSEFAKLLFHLTIVKSSTLMLIRRAIVDRKSTRLT